MPKRVHEARRHYRTTLSPVLAKSAYWKGLPSVNGSPLDQYEIVDVRTSRRVLRPALLIPKAVLKARGRLSCPSARRWGLSVSVRIEEKQVKRGK